MVLNLQEIILDKYHTEKHNFEFELIFSISGFLARISQSIETQVPRGLARRYNL